MKVKNESENITFHFGKIGVCQLWGLVQQKSFIYLFPFEINFDESEK